MLNYQLAFQWVDHLNSEITENLGSIPESDELLKLYYGTVNLKDIHRMRQTHPIFIKALQEVNINAPSDIRNAFYDDMMCFGIIKEWEKNKQIFKMDTDFIDTLLATETLSLTRDIFDYLPFKCFYIDISDNMDFCEKINGKGLFVKICPKIPTNGDYYRYNGPYKDETDEVWDIRICKVNENYYYSDSIIIPNSDNIKLQFDENKINTINEYIYDEKNNPIGKKKRNIYFGTYEKFIALFLNYLASYKPDVVESEETKRTYKKRNPESKPRNKYSEIQAHEVGFTIGTSVRQWKKAQASYESDSSSIPTGRKNRPHAVRAHWQNYWYGTGEEKVKRPVWKHEFFTGMNNTNTETIATVHKVKEI